MPPSPLLRRARLAVFASTLSASFLFAPTPAFAADPAAAQSLFDTAKRLMNDGRFADACPKLEESERLDPGTGTLFQLAVCYEHIGRTASAWAAFLEVAGRARAAGQHAREAAARGRASVLERTLPRLVIGVHVRGSEAPAGTEITRDGETVGSGQWGTPVPVDPGEHRIVAKAPGHKTWTTSVVVRGDGKIVSVVVPPLEDDAPVVVAPPPLAASSLPPAPLPSTPSTEPITSTDSSIGSGQRTAGVVLISVGLASLATGGAFVLASRGASNASGPHCNGNVCDATGVERRDDARTYGNIASITLGAGAAVFVGGIVTFLTAPSSAPRDSVASSRRAQLTPLLGAGTTGLAFTGSF